MYVEGDTCRSIASQQEGDEGRVILEGKGRGRRIRIWVETVRRRGKVKGKARK